MLRPISSSDLHSCVNLFVETFAHPPWNETWDPETVRQRLDQIFQTPGAFGVGIGDENLTGFALGVSEPWHEGTHFFLKEVCIDPQFQRQGLGSKLMAYLTEQLMDRNTQWIYLLTARGDISESFYEKLGFYTSPKMILMAKRFSTEAAQPTG